VPGTRPGNPRITLFGNFGTLNIGNECTLQAILYNIRRYLPASDVNCVCSIPADVRVRHGLPAFPMSRRSSEMATGGSRRSGAGAIGRAWRWLFRRIPEEGRELARIRRILKGRDMLIMTGTGMLADGGEGPFGLPYEIFKWSLMARLGRVRLLFVSVGVERISRRLTRWFVKSSLRRADYVGFRDRQSQAYMNDMGYRRASVVYPDLAFSLPDPPSGAASGPASDRPVVGMGLYDYCGRGEGSGQDARRNYQAYLAKLADFVVWLVNGSYPVRILIGDVSYDTAVRADLRSLLESRGLAYDDNGIVDEPVSSVPGLLDQIRSTDIVVASRFHNVILSLLLGKPVVSIAYNVKNDAVMASVGLEEFCLRIEDFDVGPLIEKFRTLESRRSELPGLVRSRTLALRAALDEQYRRILFAGRL
jgi:polysaccharide pyruvyl transferase WcaK-like protein